MYRTESYQKKIVIDVLSKSFEDNKSVSYIVKQDKHRKKRIKALMEYSYEICSMFGEVLISENESACALLLYPDKKRTTLKSIILDLRLIFKCVGLKNIKKTIHRESLIKAQQPKTLMTYLWFIGVDKSEQNKGKGTRLLQSIISESDKNRRTICLETSTVKNIPWYKKLGFEIYAEVDLTYHLYFLKRDYQR